MQRNCGRQEELEKINGHNNEFVSSIKSGKGVTRNVHINEARREREKN